jgi:hypothetical protein
MPQHRIKTKQVTPTAGTKYLWLIGDIFNTSDVKQGALQLITKGQTNRWPGADWKGTIHLLAEPESEEIIEEEKLPLKQNNSISF